jgi:hypothetical protein
VCFYHLVGIGLPWAWDFYWFFSFSYPQRPFIDGGPRNSFSAYLVCLLIFPLLFIFRGICSLALIYPDTERASREIYHHFLYIHISSHQSLSPSIQIFPLSNTLFSLSRVYSMAYKSSPVIPFCCARGRCYDSCCRADLPFSPLYNFVPPFLEYDDDCRRLKIL